MENEKKYTYLDISALMVAKVVGVLLVFYVLFLVKQVLAILFVSFILSSALEPWVKSMQDRKIPRFASMIGIYGVLFTIISSVLYLLVPPVIEQAKTLLNDFPLIWNRIASGIDFLDQIQLKNGVDPNAVRELEVMGNNFQGAAGSVMATISRIFGGIASFFLVLVITFYMVVEEDAVKKIVWSIAPAEHQVHVMRLLARIQTKIGLWLRGQLILSLIISTLVYIMLSIFGLKYALVLAILAGLTEFVPYLGPVLASIPAVIFAFTISPMLAVFIAAAYYIIQLTENNLIVPKVMQKVVGLNPVISISVLMIGFKIGGVGGAVLAIPTATALSVLVEDFFERKQKSEA